MLPTYPFGATGHTSTRVIFGAAALASMTAEQAAVTMQEVTASGINHIDTAAAYGHSEQRLRPWLAAHRSSVFLATKTGDRDGPGARASLERSLERLGVDQVDLIQLHNLVEEDEWRQAFTPGGALSALVAARDEGLCRFIGVTGHGLRIPGMHRRSLDEFPFDSVLLPFNHPLLAIPSYRSEVEELLTVCEERDVAVQTIKSVARRRWANDDPGPHASWYEPLDDPAAIERAVHYVLGRPRLFLNSASDPRLLAPTLAAARSAAAPPDDADMEADRIAHEISPLFDGGELERI